MSDLCLPGRLFLEHDAYREARKQCDLVLSKFFIQTDSPLEEVNGVKGRQECYSHQVTAQYMKMFPGVGSFFHHHYHTYTTIQIYNQEEYVIFLKYV